MTGFFALLVYIGGISAMADRGIGFFRCLIWPYYLGRWLGEFAAKGGAT